MIQRKYVWNERNLMQESSENRQSVYYRYGADGQRALKSSNQSETLYFNTMWSWLHNSSAYNTERESKHIYLGSERLVTRTNGAGTQGNTYTAQVSTYYYHSDHLGSAQLITDNEGREYERIEYTPYGEYWIEKSRAEGILKSIFFTSFAAQNSVSNRKVASFTGKERDEETGLYYYGARYLDAKTSRWLTTDPALGEYLDQSSKGEGGAFNVLNLNLYHYGNNNPVKYTDPDGESVFGAAIIGGLISAGIDYAFQVGGNYLQGKRGAELLTDVNAGEIVGAFVSGALTTVGLGAVTKVVGIAESTIARKGIQIAGSAAVSAAASVPGTIAENFVNNKINPDNKVALAKNIKDNAIKSGIAGGLVSVGAKTPPKNVKTPSWYEPNNIPYKQVGPNKYVRKGLMPGTKQAGVIQFTKDVMNEVYGQGVSKGVSAGYDKFTTHKKEHSIEN